MKKNPSQSGKVITFYSFKGGVGRSMALANVAALMAKWDYGVLIIDWDLEAPGLENFYKEYIDINAVESKAGLIDLLTDDTIPERANKFQWRDCVVPISLGKYTTSKIDLITAGNITGAYYDKVRSFDFGNFYKEHDGGEKIEKLRNEWIAEYDFVLIDSRTGVTDIGGVCTVQLPDVLVIMFTPTNQSLQGVKNVAQKAMAAQRKLPYDRINLLTLPVPARIDNSEYLLSQQWFEIFENELKDFYLKWIPEYYASMLNQFLVNGKIPYISYFSFGEKLPVVEDGVSNPTGMGYAYESLAALLATRLNYPSLLIEDRTKLVRGAEGSISLENSSSGFENRGKRTKTNSPFQILNSVSSFLSRLLIRPGVRFIKRYPKVTNGISVLIIAAIIASGFFANKQIDFLQSDNVRLLDSLKYQHTVIDSYAFIKSYLQEVTRMDTPRSVYRISDMDPTKVGLDNAINELNLGAKDIGKKNSGPFVAKYNNIVGLGEGYPWATTFVSWCFDNNKIYFKPSANTAGLESTFIDGNATYKLTERTLPQPGDIYFYDWKGQRALGIVEYFSISDYVLHGIEGDSNDDDDGPNFKVARVTFDKKELATRNFNFAKVGKLPR